MWRRGYVSTAFGCPYQGAVQRRWCKGRRRAADMGCRRSRWATPSGSLCPRGRRPWSARLIARSRPSGWRCTCTTPAAGPSQRGGRLDWGATFDGSAAGPAAPFAPGAPGNLATQTLLE